VASQLAASGYRLAAAGRSVRQLEEDDPELWSPPELAADLIEFIGTGALDDLSGRYIHAAADDWRALPARSRSILDQDLMSLRLRRAEPDREGR
jgi:hypothetical protein